MKLGFILHLIVISIVASLFVSPKGAPTTQTEILSQNEIRESASLTYLSEEL